MLKLIHKVKPLQKASKKSSLMLAKNNLIKEVINMSKARFISCDGNCKDLGCIRLHSPECLEVIKNDIVRFENAQDLIHTDHIIKMHHELSEALKDQESYMERLKHKKRFNNLSCDCNEFPCVHYMLRMSRVHLRDLNPYDDCDCHFYPCVHTARKELDIQPTLYDRFKPKPNRPKDCKCVDCLIKKATSNTVTKFQLSELDNKYSDITVHLGRELHSLDIQSTLNKGKISYLETKVDYMGEDLKNRTNEIFELQGKLFSLQLNVIMLAIAVITIFIGMIIWGFLYV